jgi:hypothetical protein
MMKSGLSADGSAAAASVDETRLWQALMDLAAVGARSDGGVCRHALSDEDIAARALVIGWAEARGYEPSVDEAANLFIRRRGRDNDAAPVLAGSHMDSQPAGGKFDGAYGVLSGLEVLMALDDAGVETERPIDIVAWTNEEGGRFDRSCTGSSIWSGVSELESYLGDIGADGVPLGEALEKTLAATPDLARRPRHWTPHAFIEPHIEQGPVLEAQGLSVAAVTGIQGVRWMNVEVIGRGRPCRHHADGRAARCGARCGARRCRAQHADVRPGRPGAVHGGPGERHAQLAQHDPRKSAVLDRLPPSRARPAGRPRRAHRRGRQGGRAALARRCWCRRSPWIRRRSPRR